MTRIVAALMGLFLLVFVTPASADSPTVSGTPPQSFEIRGPALDAFSKALLEKIARLEAELAKCTGEKCPEKKPPAKAVSVATMFECPNGSIVPRVVMCPPCDPGKIFKPESVMSTEIRTEKNRVVKKIVCVAPGSMIGTVERHTDEINGAKAALSRKFCGKDDVPPEKWIECDDTSVSRLAISRLVAIVNVLQTQIDSERVASWEAIDELRGIVEMIPDALQRIRKYAFDGYFMGGGVAGVRGHGGWNAGGDVGVALAFRISNGVGIMGSFDVYPLAEGTFHSMMFGLKGGLGPIFDLDDDGRYRLYAQLSGVQFMKTNGDIATSGSSDHATGGGFGGTLGATIDFADHFGVSPECNLWGGPVSWNDQGTPMRDPVGAQFNCGLRLYFRSNIGSMKAPRPGRKLNAKDNVGPQYTPEQVLGPYGSFPGDEPPIGGKSPEPAPESPKRQ